MPMLNRGHFIHEISAWIDRPDAQRAYSIHRDGDAVFLRTWDISGAPVDMGTGEIPLRTARHYGAAWNAFACTNCEWLAQIEAAEFAARGTACAAIPGCKIKFYYHVGALQMRLWLDHKAEPSSVTPVHDVSEMARKYPEAWAAFVAANGGVDPAAPPAPRAPQPMPGEILPSLTVPAVRPVPLPGESLADLEAVTARRVREQYAAQAQKSAHAAAVAERQRQSEENQKRMDQIARNRATLGL